MDLELSIYIGKLLAAVYLILGVAILANRAYFTKAYSQFIDNPLSMLLAGFMALVLGLILVMNHNIWVGEWYVLITIVGWISLIKGVFLLLLPKVTDQIWGPIIRKGYIMPVAGIFALLFGIYFGYFTWLA